MSETPSWETVREAIRLIKESTPEAGSWAELDAVERLLPKDPVLWETSLPEDARDPVRELFGRLGIQPPRPFGPCLWLSRWAGLEPNA